MSVSIEEAIQRLKAEIIAQDWRLSQKRADALEAAFACLRERFRNRKSTQAILFMVGSVVGYIKKRGDILPAAIDFLKEAMAHVVSLYEDLDFDPEKEEKIFTSLFQKFNKLKTTIKAQSAGGDPGNESEENADLGGAGSRAAGEASAHESGSGGWPPGDEQLSARASGWPAATVGSPANLALSLTSADVPALLGELHSALARAEAVGQLLRQLVQTLEAPAVAIPSTPNPEAQLAEEDAMVTQLLVEAEEAPEPPLPEVMVADQGEPPIVSRPQGEETCPPVAVRQLVFGEARVLVAEESIALLRPVGPESLQSYVKSGNVPLKEFGGFLQSLSRQFHGSLAAIKDKNLKKLMLPLMTPCGLGLPEAIDEQATHLLVVSDADWNGVLVGSAEPEAGEYMVKFRPEPNGDISGVGFLENGVQLPLLDIKFILRREGFLVMA